MYSFGCFAIHSVFPILPLAHDHRGPTSTNDYRLNHPTPSGFVRDIPLWPSLPERSAIKALFLTIEITPLKQNASGLPDRTGLTDESA